MPQLRPYQVESVAFLAARKKALLALEMRLGKSASAIVAAHTTGAKTIAIACPAIAVPQWERQIEMWWPSGSLPFFKIASYERWTNLWKDGLTGTVDVFIPDEAHFAKNPDAKRTQMVYGNRGIGARAGSVWALSGTPAPKHAAELWPMMRSFGVVQMDYQDFVNRYCEVDWFTGAIKGTKVKHIPELRALLATFMLRRTRKEVAPDMPEIGFEFLEVEPPQTVGYFGPDPTKGLSDDHLATWLDAHANQTYPDLDRQTTALAKVEPLFQHVKFAMENGLLSQTVIFGWHREPLLRLSSMLNEAGISAYGLLGGLSEGTRQVMQASFLRGETQVVCAQIRAAGTAIDLSAARHGYFLELDWVPGNNAQAAARLISLAKPDPVTFDVVTWPGSFDDRIQRVLIRRTKELAQLL